MTWLNKDQERKRAILFLFDHAKVNCTTAALKSRLTNVFEPGHEKMCLMPYVNNKGADQTAHPRSLISAFVVRCQGRMIPLVYICKISRFLLVSVAEQVGLCLAWS